MRQLSPPLLLPSAASASASSAAAASSSSSASAMQNGGLSKYEYCMREAHSYKEHGNQYLKQNDYAKALSRYLRVAGE